MGRLAYVIYRLVNVYETLIVIRCIMTWFPIRPGTLIGDIQAALATLVDPYLNLFRQFMPRMQGVGLDFSPIVAILVLEAVMRLLL